MLGGFLLDFVYPKINKQKHNNNLWVRNIVLGRFASMSPWRHCLSMQALAYSLRIFPACSDDELCTTPPSPLSPRSTAASWRNTQHEVDSSPGPRGGFIVLQSIHLQIMTPCPVLPRVTCSGQSHDEELPHLWRCDFEESPLFYFLTGLPFLSTP